MFSIYPICCPSQSIEQQVCYPTSNHTLMCLNSTISSISRKTVGDTLICDSPFIKITGIHTGSSTAEVSAGQALVRTRTPTPCVRTQRITHHAILGALLWASVVSDQNLLVGRAEQPRPVDGAVVAELAVLRDVDVPSADLSEGLELQ